jgi:hypothetical protein
MSPVYYTESLPATLRSRTNVVRQAPATRPGDDVRPAAEDETPLKAQRSSPRSASTRTRSCWD